ncbi:hypothetical protein AB0J35_25010 [Nonomuraea angiospora]|uniref:hypothetical protein n=1 Tax=Nonomuraea angiospora TaxID=46172 RepID=UPI00344404D0
MVTPFSITPEEGVRTGVWLATADPPPEPSGGFFSDSAPAGTWPRSAGSRTSHLRRAEPLS